MELRSAGYRGTYLAEYLAVGEAPEELRNVLRQRSRWTKGHRQVFFSARNPLLRFQRRFDFGNHTSIDNALFNQFSTTTCVQM